jgi:hypothetical protein
MNSDLMEERKGRVDMINYLPRYSALLLILIVTMFLMACTGTPQNSNTAPGPAPAVPPSANTPPLYQGAHDVANCDVIAGWAWDKNKPDTQVNVDIFDGDTLIATVPARLFRPDLRDLGMGNGQHAFHYVVPPTLKDGKPHTIQVKVTGTNTLLNSSPKALTCASSK